MLFHGKKSRKVESGSIIDISIKYLRTPLPLYSCSMISTNATCVCVCVCVFGVSILLKNYCSRLGLSCEVVKLLAVSIPSILGNLYCFARRHFVLSQGLGLIILLLLEIQEQLML